MRSPARKGRLGPATTTEGGRNSPNKTAIDLDLPEIIEDVEVNGGGIPTYSGAKTTEPKPH